MILYIYGPTLSDTVLRRWVDFQILMNQLELDIERNLTSNPVNSFRMYFTDDIIRNRKHYKLIKVIKQD